MLARIASTSAWKRAPCSVSSSRRVVRRISSAPSRSSSRASRFDTIGGESRSTRAAPARLPLATICAKSR
jgi:hypothetical protein